MFNQEPTSWVLPDATSHVLGLHPVVVTTASPNNANQFALDFAQAFLHSNNPMSHDQMVKWVTKAAALIEEQARRVEELEHQKEMLIIDIQNIGTDVRDAMKAIIGNLHSLSDGINSECIDLAEYGLSSQVIDEWANKANISCDLIDNALESLTDDIQEAIEKSNED